MKTAIKLVSLLTLVSIASSCSEKPTSNVLNTPEFPMTFNGSSDKLKATEVVPTLDTPIPNGKNAIWCASFLAAWKTMQKELTQGPISLDGSSEVVKSLNNAADPQSYIPSDSLYVAAGWKQNGIIEKIQTDLKQKFPAKEPPTFPETTPNSFIAYSYLEANVKFSLPFFKNRERFEFTDGEGKKTGIHSFGIRQEDDYAYWKLRAEPRVLFRKGDIMDSNLEFAIDLCADSSPSQIVVARIAREPTLASALARIEKESASTEELRKTKGKDYVNYLQRIGPNDVLLVPDVFYFIRHRFSQLEGKSFQNPKLQGQLLNVAQQDIQFRLDRSGADLKSESKVLVSPTPTYFVLDRPFLIYMKKRGAQTPFFAMWIDNVELLRAWQDNEKQSH